MTPPSPPSSLPIEAALTRISPFKYLDATQREALAGVLEPVAFEDGETIIHQGADDAKLYITLTGQVGIFDERAHPERFLGSIGPMSYFGERAALFGPPRLRKICAQGPVTALALDGAVFLNLIAGSTRFAQALARNLREKQGLFENLERFRTRVFSAASSGSVDFEALVDDYRALKPALHSELDSPAIDVSAWYYALRRLPDNITRVHSLLLSRTVPTLLAEVAEFAPRVETAARRRLAWALSEGKTMVLVRDGRTDLLDLLTNLALHATEARKLRRRIRSPKVVTETAKALADGPEACRDCLSSLPLSQAELDGLRRIWPRDLLRRIHELLIHHEDFSVYIDRALNNYNADAAERWTEQIRLAADELMGGLDDVVVDVISSNTHSVVNCLSPFFVETGAEIRSWGRRHAPDLSSAPFANPEDRLYALSYRWFKANPNELLARRAREAEVGIRTLDVTELTGLQVDLIAPHRLDPEGVDPSLRGFTTSPRHLIVNIDYAFGYQAEDIMGSLVLLFGDKLRSVNVLGKAGALTGDRGDILMPTQVLQQTADFVHPIGQQGLSAQRLAELGGCGVHQGPVLTVAGTLLQNRELLRFYERLWRCVGLEMEGSFYARQIERSRDLGMLRADIATRFLYYVSDLPLSDAHDLSAPLAPWEGIPPLYATTRAILEQILPPARP